MPESKSRKKATYTPPPAKSTGPKVNAPWFLPVMLGLMILGLVWIVVTYLTQSQYPIPGIDQGTCHRVRAHRRRLRDDDALALTPVARPTGRRRHPRAAPSSTPGPGVRCRPTSPPPSPEAASSTAIPADLRKRRRLSPAVHKSVDNYTAVVPQVWGTVGTVLAPSKPALQAIVRRARAAPHDVVQRLAPHIAVTGPVRRGGRRSTRT